MRVDLQMAIIYSEHHQRRRPFLLTRLMMVTGEVLSGDMSFKVAKRILSNDGKFFECTYTLMNEHNEILGFWFCRSKSILQVGLPPHTCILVQTDMLSITWGLNEAKLTNYVWVL